MLNLPIESDVLFKMKNLQITMRQNCTFGHFECDNTKFDISNWGTRGKGLKRGCEALSSFFFA